MSDLEVRTYALPYDDARAFMQLVGAEYISLFRSPTEEHAFIVAFEEGTPVKYAERIVRDGVTFCTAFRAVPRHLISSGLF